MYETVLTTEDLHLCKEIKIQCPWNIRSNTCMSPFLYSG